MNRKDTVWDYEHGRWLCLTRGDAYDIMDKHPGDTIYLYDRDENGKMTNLRLFFASWMTQSLHMPTIAGGKIRQSE